MIAIFKLADSYTTDELLALKIYTGKRAVLPRESYKKKKGVYSINYTTVYYLCVFDYETMREYSRTLLELKLGPAVAIVRSLPEANLCIDLIV